MSHKNKDDTVTCACMQLYSNCAPCTSCVFPIRGTFLLAEDLYAYSKRVCVCVCVSTVAQHSGGWGSSSICDVAWMKRKLGHDTALLFCYCCLALTLDGDSLRHTHAYTFVHTRRNLKVV